MRLLIYLSLILCGLAFGQGLTLKNPAFVASLKTPAAAGGGGADASENFEPSTYQLSWVEESGNANPDQATTGLSLEGSECLFVNAESETDETYLAFTASDTAYAYFLMRVENEWTAERRQFAFKNNTTTICEMSGPAAPMQWRVCDDTVCDTGGFVSADTTYHVWLEYEKGTGANAQIRLYVSTDGTKPGSADAEITNSGMTVQANRFYVGTWGTPAGDIYYDKFRLSRTAAFGSNPP